MRRAVVGILAIITLAIAANAQTSWFGTTSATPGATSGADCPKDRSWAEGALNGPIDPAATDTYSMRFVGRTLTGVSAYSVTLLRGTDSAPTALVAPTPTASGDTVSLVITPNSGCGTSGCRDGNWYSIYLRAAESGGVNFPAATACIQVKGDAYRVPQ